MSEFEMKLLEQLSEITKELQDIKKALEPKKVVDSVLNENAHINGDYIRRAVNAAELAIDISGVVEDRFQKLEKMINLLTEYKSLHEDVFGKQIIN